MSKVTFIGLFSDLAWFTHWFTTPSLCVYIEILSRDRTHTASVRGEAQLLFCVCLAKKGRGVSTQRISQGLVGCIGMADRTSGEASLWGVKGHQTSYLVACRDWTL